jgi:hypothetical protein
MIFRACKFSTFGMINAKRNCWMVGRFFVLNNDHADDKRLAALELDVSRTPRSARSTTSSQDTGMLAREPAIKDGNGG